MIAELAVEHRADLSAHDDHRRQDKGNFPRDDNVFDVDEFKVTKDDGQVRSQCR